MASIFIIIDIFNLGHVTKLRISRSGVIYHALMLGAILGPVAHLRVSSFCVMVTHYECKFVCRPLVLRGFLKLSIMVRCDIL